MGIDRRQRYLEDFLKVGRTGKKYYCFGAPDGRDGPYDSSKEADAVYKEIIANFESYEVVGRKVVRKDAK